MLGEDGGRAGVEAAHRRELGVPVRDGHPLRQLFPAVPVGAGAGEGAVRGVSVLRGLGGAAGVHRGGGRVRRGVRRRGAYPGAGGPGDGRAAAGQRGHACGVPAVHPGGPRRQPRGTLWGGVRGGAGAVPRGGLHRGQRGERVERGAAVRLLLRRGDAPV